VVSELNTASMMLFYWKVLQLRLRGRVHKPKASGGASGCSLRKPSQR
jgi:hypothetical protein